MIYLFEPKTNHSLSKIINDYLKKNQIMESVILKSQLHNTTISHKHIYLIHQSQSQGNWDWLTIAKQIRQALPEAYMIFLAPQIDYTKLIKTRLCFFTAIETEDLDLDELYNHLDYCLQNLSKALV